MRTAVACAFAMLVGCGPSLLPTTLFHTPLAAGAEPADGDWRRLTATDEVVALAPVSEGEWVIWARRPGGAGLLARVRRTEIGLEAQSVGPHVGAAIRPSVRSLTVAGVRIVIVESSSADDSTERDAWLYAEHAGEIVPLSLDGGPGRIRVRSERQTPLERGWARVATLTATFEAGEATLVVHEHESVREIAEDRPELPARSTYDVERARQLRRVSATLTSDRPSLFDDDAS